MFSRLSIAYLLDQKSYRVLKAVKSIKYLGKKSRVNKAVKRLVHNHNKAVRRLVHNHNKAVRRLVHNHNKAVRRLVHNHNKAVRRLVHNQSLTGVFRPSTLNSLVPRHTVLKRYCDEKIKG